MKHIGQELFKIIKQKKLVKKEIAEQVGITAIYLSVIMKKDSIDAELLERISKAVGISPAYFFDDYIDNNRTNKTQENIDLLKYILEEKERTIKILMKAKGLN